MLGHARPAAADVVERVVAIVDHRPILLSEVEHRARLDLIAEHRTVATRSDLKAALETIIDERTMERAAALMHVTISSAEVEHAVTRERWARAQSMGYSASDYREMVRMQLLDAKLSAIWFTRPMHPTPDEVWAAYEHLRHQPDGQRVELEVLLLRVQSSAGATEAAVRNLVQRARAGEDWCTLAKRAMGTSACRGDRVSASGLIEPARSALAAMKDSDISEPIRVGDRAVFAFKLVRRVPPDFEEVRMDAELDAELDLYTRLRRERLDELRRQASVEVRL